MVDTAAPAPTSGVFEAIQQQHQASHPRRARPPDLNLATGEDGKVPLKSQTEKLHRRRSRLALSGLFGRGKPNRQLPEEVETKDAPPKSGGLRASIAGIGSWPYGLSGQRSESALSSIAQSSEPPAKSPLGGGADLKHRKAPSAAKPQPSPKPTRGSLATWDPPPLFQAYPQAIKHAHLPACTLNAEAILKLQGHKGSVSVRDGINQTALNLGTIEESAAEKADKSKKKHRRNTSTSSLKSDWTTKIYVLVTSGYLLQYAGEGTFDRLPEKVLHLGKDSAAFASDVIPRRHWVLQVSSVADSDGSAAGQPSSLLSRLPFRGAERRQASNFLMVFESAEDMDSWIATLRREIEALGGKKNLSETGKPKVDGVVLQLRAQPSQRTLVVKDPDRFSRNITHLPWDPPASTTTSPDIHIDSSDLDAAREQSFDETSTASGVSQDGRQLDGLRDSTNRLSFISSGQRTMVTSAGSSPACSPTRDSFASQPDELTLRENPPTSDVQLRVLPRPNASAIMDRRQSMQAMNHIFEMRLAAARPHSTYTGQWEPESPVVSSLATVPTIPNFSVPHSMGKRYSLTKAVPQDHTSPPMSPPLQSRAPPAKTHRPPPPSALSINARPLSLVEDQPSPTGSPRNRSRRGSTQPEEVGTPDSPSAFSTWAQAQDGYRHRSPSPGFPARHSHPLREETDVRTIAHDSPRKHASMTTIRPSDMETGATKPEKTRTIMFPERIAMPPPVSANNHRMSAEIPRSRSAMDHYTRSRSPVLGQAMSARHQKRTSLGSPVSDIFPRYSMAESVRTVTSVDSQDLLSRSISPTFRPPAMSPRVSTSNQHLRVSSLSKSLLNRRSMSQLVEGPPPAPPPTCALPPIPRKAS